MKRVVEDLVKMEDSHRRVTEPGRMETMKHRRNRMEMHQMDRHLATEIPISRRRNRKGILRTTVTVPINRAAMILLLIPTASHRKNRKEKATAIARILQMQTAITQTATAVTAKARTTAVPTVRTLTAANRTDSHRKNRRETDRRQMAMAVHRNRAPKPLQKRISRSAIR